MKINHLKSIVGSLVFAFLFTAASIMAATPGKSSQAGFAKSFLGALVSPRIAADKNVYKPGDTVMITGTGFNRFERVELIAESYDSAANENTVLVRWEIYSDARGRISTVLSFDFLRSADGPVTVKAFGAGSKTSAETTISTAAASPAAPPIVRIVKNTGNLQTNYQFQFQLRGNITSDFALDTDPNTATPSQRDFNPSNNSTVTIEEVNLSNGWVVADRKCVQSGSPNQNPVITYDSFSNKVTISNIRNDAIITCTYVNDLLLAANATVTGRVSMPGGRGIRNVLVNAMDLSTGQIISARTNSFGYYRLTELQVGGSYLVTVKARGYSFEPASRILSIGEDLAEVDFISQP